MYCSLNLVMIVLKTANLTGTSYTNTLKRFTPNCNFTVHVLSILCNDASYC